MPVYPATDSEADRAAAQRFDGFINRWYLGAAAARASIRPTCRAPRPAGAEDRGGDLERISPPIDFFGHNSYTRAVVRDDPDSALTGARRSPAQSAKTAMGWEIYPDHLYDALTRITRDYGAPDIYITENGAAFRDEVVNGAGR